MFSAYGVGPENQHCEQLPESCWCSWSGDHILGMAAYRYCGKEEAPVPILTFFILVAGRIFEVGWMV